MRRTRPLLTWIVVLFVALLTSFAPALPPGSVIAPFAAAHVRQAKSAVVNPLGVNVHAPAKYLPDNPANMAEWAAFDALLASLPKGTPIRVPLYWYEWAWSKTTVYGFEHIDAKVRYIAKYDLPVIWEGTPLPWAGSWWSPIAVWGAVALEDFPELVKRFGLGMTLLRQSMAKYGMPEKGTKFHLGNEPASGHPGGNIGLPKGEWYDRVGSLYEQMVKGADFGGLTLVLPSLSMQDHDADTALRERTSAQPFLRKIARAKKGGGAIASTHMRLHAPNVSTVAYAAAWLDRLGKYLKTARDLSGRPNAIATEVYLFREDRPANLDDRAEILRIVAPKLPPGTFLYRVGPGPSDPSTQLPVDAVKAANAASRGS